MSRYLRDCIIHRWTSLFSTFSPFANIYTYIDVHEHVFVYIYNIYIYSFVFCIYIYTETEMANLCLFAANGNGKRKFDFLGQQTINVNDVCFFSKFAHLC